MDTTHDTATTARKRDCKNSLLNPANPNHQFPTEGFARAKECARFHGIGLSTWWLWVKEGKAPPGTKLGSRTTVFDAAQVRQLAKDLAEGVAK